jgi:uncharacterized phage protein gp47/JayE
MINIESIEDVSEQIVQDIESKTNEVTPGLDISVNRAYADALAAQSAVSKLHNIDQYRECFVKTASEFIGLPLLSEETGVTRDLGTQASFKVNVTGQEGTVIGTFGTGPQFTANDIVYKTTVGSTISGGIAEITLKADVSGTEGNLQVTDELSLSSTFANIDDIATVTEIVTTGTSKESVESWRAKIAQEQAFPSRVGGGVPWFARVAKNVEGITRVFTYSGDVLGDLDMFCVADAEIDGIPTPAQLIAVKSQFTISPNDLLWSSLPGRITALSSTKESYSVDIQLGAPAPSQSTQDAIEAAVDTYFKNRAPFIEGYSLLNTSVVSRAEILAVAQNVISGTTGEEGLISNVVVTKAATPPADIYPIAKGLRAKGVITFS